MTAPSQKSLIAMLALLVLISLGVLGVITLRESNAAADHSAHAALTAEVCDQLSAIPRGQLYPASLSQLRLKFPDGGDASLLKRFTYHSTGTNCTVGTRLSGVEIFRSFP
jgi:hypothetical protein